MLYFFFKQKEALFIHNVFLSIFFKPDAFRVQLVEECFALVQIYVLCINKAEILYSESKYGYLWIT